MKVILAGMSKTGTKTMASALRELDMNVYDYLEHYHNNRDEWLRICEGGGTVEDFRRMHKGVDAVVDMPAWCFWEELHEAFPEAKIILTMRDNEDQWFNSQKVQIESMDNLFIHLMRYLSPTYRRLHQYGTALGIMGYGILNRSKFKVDINELVMKMAYRRHNTYVLERAPKDKLLVYNVKEGWEPLCRFLGVEIPSKPFPHKNARAKYTDEVMATDPLFIRMQREMMVSSTVLALLLAYGCYKIVRFSFSSSTPLGYYQSFISLSASLADKCMFWK